LPNVGGRRTAVQLVCPMDVSERQEHGTICWHYARLLPRLVGRVAEHDAPQTGSWGIEKMPVNVCRFGSDRKLQIPRYQCHDLLLRTRLPTSFRVLFAITTVFGAAIPCNRAARFGVSPTMACSWPDLRCRSLRICLLGFNHRSNPLRACNPRRRRSWRYRRRCPDCDWLVVSVRIVWRDENIKRAEHQLNAAFSLGKTSHGRAGRSVTQTCATDSHYFHTAARFHHY
jgi:hypothetical protein